MSRETVYVDGLTDHFEKAGLPIAAATKGAGLVFVSGTPPVDNEDGGFATGDVKEQTRLCMEQIDRTLQDAGSSLKSVLQVTIYAVDPDDYAEINEAYAECFEESYPARSFVPVVEWNWDFDVEIECIALAEEE